MTSRSLRRRVVALLATLGLAGTMLGGLIVPVAAASSAGAGPATCDGQFPLASKTYTSLAITGFCVMPSGTNVVVKGGLTVAPGATLFANSFMDGKCDRSLTVSGGVTIGAGGTLILGDSAIGTGCVGATTVIRGGLVGDGPLMVVVHGATIDGGVSSSGGGDGLTCPPPGSPSFGTFSTIEDSQINGHVSISGYNACWLGFARNHVNGGVSLTNNTLDDPDAMEILANTIQGGLACSGNSPLPKNIADGVFLEPNTVTGQETGQCVGL